MKALVTGTAGFIGSKLAASLIQAGHEVIGIDRMSEYYDTNQKKNNVANLKREGGFTFIEKDLADLNKLDLPADLTTVFHLAAQPGVRGSWGSSFAEYAGDNIVATQRLLECVSNMPNPPRIIYSSSSSVYGNAADFPTQTTTKTMPISPYGVTKLAGETLIGAYASSRGIQAVSLRYFTVYGPGQRPDMATHRLIEAAIQGREFTVIGDGRQIRDFTYVDDVVNANVLAASAELIAGHEIFNVSGGAQTSLIELIDVVSKVVGKRVRCSRIQASPGDPSRTKGDSSQTFQRLGWRPRVKLSDGVAAQAAWHRSRLAENSAAA